MHLSLGVTTRRVAMKDALSGAIKYGLCHDGARRATGAQEKHVARVRLRAALQSGLRELTGLLIDLNWQSVLYLIDISKVDIVNANKQSRHEAGCDRPFDPQASRKIRGARGCGDGARLRMGGAAISHG